MWSTNIAEVLDDPLIVYIVRLWLVGGTVNNLVSTLTYQHNLHTNLILHISYPWQKENRKKQHSHPNNWQQINKEKWKRKWWKMFYRQQHLWWCDGSDLSRILPFHTLRVCATLSMCLHICVYCGKSTTNCRRIMINRSHGKKLCTIKYKSINNNLR